MAAAPSNHGEQDSTDGFQRHGSIRKVLHTLVGNDSLLGKSAKMLDRPKTKFEDNAYSEYFREYSIIYEYNTVCDHPIPGLYVIPSANSCLVWYGVIFIHTGAYRGGVFRFSIEIPEDFPSSVPPKVFMGPCVFHPAVDPNTNELNVKDVFPRWSQTANRLWQVLEYMHSIFQEISTTSPLNKEATKLYEMDRDRFLEKARACAEASASKAIRSTYHDSDAHYIRFSDFDDSVHSSVKSLLLNQASKR
ncbi:crossbronx [Nesidiocoris tenuis]|uniref:Crossbronx n=1 Tax=Nesidiocoris tenuis TaxID=355587 RepID=A0ABN7ACR7_9HEMI|nr:crossbronx [Nesidiocoris tenuis]